MESKEDKIAFFQAVTGADHETAEHVLEAHGWDLNRGVNFYMESSAAPEAERPEPRISTPEEPLSEPEDVADMEADRPPQRANARRGPGGRDSDAIDVDDDDDDAMLTAALTASLKTETGEAEAPPQSHRISRPQNGWLSDNADEDEEEDAPPQARSYDDAGYRSRQNSARSRGRRSIRIDDLPEARVRRNRPRGAAAEDPIMAFLGGNGMRPRSPDDGDTDGFFGPLNAARHQNWPPPLIVDGRIPERFVRGSTQTREDIDLPQIPDGINVEEARMLEAAFLGVPYEGRIPDFSQAEAAEPMSPSVMAGRQLRQEQDQAYQDSLQADKVKADTAEAKRRAADEALQREAEARESAAVAQRDYEREIEEKSSRLPAEPPIDDPEAITVLIRSPTGQKFGRRFRRSNPFSDLFSFVDVKGAPDFRAGQYKLVTQFPRRAFESDKEGTLQDAGLSQKQEALFLEQL